MILRLTLKRIFTRKIHSLLIILSISLVWTVFFTFKFSINEYKKKWNSRDSNNPVIAGGSQSHLNTVFNGIYFRKAEVNLFPQSELKGVQQFGTAIPVFNKYTARGIPVVGIDSQYFKIKKLNYFSGDGFLQLGECVIGYSCAKKLNLKVGDTLLTDPYIEFDLSKSIPVKMIISGILAKRNSSVDDTIFTSLKTAWTIDGIGHSHTDNNEVERESYLDFSKGVDKNFHFHGEESGYPLSAAIIFCENSFKKAELLAEAKQNHFKIQIFDPRQSIDSALQSLSGIDNFFYILFFLIIIVVTLLLCVLVIQTAALRVEEKEVYKTLGIPRQFYLKLILCEWFIILVLSSFTGFILSFGLYPLFSDYITKLIL